jgi:hypothetical protein
MGEERMKDRKTKEPFQYQYTRPCLDWFEYVDVKIRPKDYYYFKLERRFGPSWWIIGMNTVEEPNYHWEEKQIGEIDERDLQRFIEWAKDDVGSKIIEIHMICSSFDIFEEVGKIIKQRPNEAAK